MNDSTHTVASVLLHDARTRSWLLFRRPVRVHCARTLDQVDEVLQSVEKETTDDGLYAAGFVAYEAGPAFDTALAAKPPGDFPLAWFGMYREPEAADDPAGFPASAAAELAWEASVSSDEYQAAIRGIRRHIRDGDTYQVNYTYRFRAPMRGDPWPLFCRMARAQRGDFAAFVDIGDWAICCASPELFFHLKDGMLVSRPMKGTAPRGLWSAQDAALASRLRSSRKNRAENVMIVDMVRNDMGRIARVGSVEVERLYDVERYPTVWQMTSTVNCRTETGIAGVFRAMFPAASITGAPKVETSRIIERLENAPRGIYTGSIGFVAPSGEAQFNVAIRTVAVDRRRAVAEYGVGGGIVWDSREGAEFEECRTKAAVLTNSVPDFSLLETILWEPGSGYYLQDQHLRRLSASAAYFGRDMDQRAIRGHLRLLAGDFMPCPHRVRLVVPDCGEARVEAQPLPEKRAAFRVCLARHPVDSADTFLYHKTTHRRVYARAMEEAQGFDDVLLWNERGELTESCIANVVVELDGRMVTPPLRCGLLPGVYRSLLLRRGEISEQVVRVEDLPRCSRIFLVNSVRRMWEAALET